MNLSEKLNYCESTSAKSSMDKYIKCFGDSNPYYTRLGNIINKQDNKEIVSDDEYKHIQNCLVSVYSGFYLVNFHYNFMEGKINNKVSLIYNFLDFLDAVDYNDCWDSDALNWKNDFSYFVRNHLGSQINIPDVKHKCDFIIKLLDTLDPINNYRIGSLLNVDRSVSPVAFDNVMNYLKSKAL